MADIDIKEGELGSRAMPDFVKRGLVRVSSGGLYLKAAYRVLWMRSEHADWSLTTSIVYADFEQGVVVMQAVVMDEGGRVLATAHCTKNRVPNKPPYLETAETTAIARALGLCGYGTQYGEMDDDEADAGQEQGSNGAVAERPAAAAGSGKCPECGVTRGEPGPHHGPKCSRRKAAA